MRPFVIALLVASPSVAQAEPETVEAELRSLAMPAVGGGRFHATGFAQLAGGHTDGSEGSVAAGGELANRGPRCDHVRLGGQLRGGYRTAVAASAEQWASVCIPITTMEFGHHLEWDVRPSLLAPLGLRTGGNRRETLTFHWQPLAGEYGHVLAAIEAGEASEQGVTLAHPMDPDAPSLPQGDLVFFDVHVEATLLWGGGQPFAMRQMADAVPFGYVRRRMAPWGEERDVSVEVGSGGGGFIESGASIHVWGLKIENLSIGPLLATGGIGIISGGAGEFVDDVTREVAITTPRAVLGVETGNSLVHGHVRATHDLELQPDGYVTVDSRLTAGIGLVWGDTRAIAEAAVAKTDVYVPKAPQVAAITGGGSLRLSQHLARHLDATLWVEAARSFYAANVRAMDFAPRWGVMAFAALQATVGR